MRRKTIKRRPRKTAVAGKDFRLAGRLARDGDPEELHFEETDASFAIGWKGNYRIDGDVFLFIDRETARITTIPGCPIRRLAQLA